MLALHENPADSRTELRENRVKRFSQNAGLKGWKIGRCVCSRGRLARGSRSWSYRAIVLKATRRKYFSSLSLSLSLSLADCHLETMAGPFWSVGRQLERRNALQILEKTHRRASSSLSLSLSLSLSASKLYTLYYVCPHVLTIDKIQRNGENWKRDIEEDG